MSSGFLLCLVSCLSGDNSSVLEPSRDCAGVFSCSFSCLWSGIPFLCARGSSITELRGYSPGLDIGLKVNSRFFASVIAFSSLDMSMYSLLRYAERGTPKWDCFERACMFLYASSCRAGSSTALAASHSFVAVMTFASRTDSSLSGSISVFRLHPFAL